MRHGFHFSSLRGTIQSGLSKKLYKMIKSENHLISSYRAAARDRIDIANQLSIWGESTDDESISDISDKIGVLLSEIGEQEDHYANKLESSRGILKIVRDTEKSVQPSRDFKSKISDEIAKLRAKEPESTRLVTLEQELVRADAENLVAEAQLTNITRKKIKEAYSTELAATIERAEKHIILARHGCRLLNLLDDSPITPGDQRQTFEYTSQARQVLNDAEDDLKDWQLDTQIFNSDPFFDAQHMPKNLNQSHQIDKCIIESDDRELSRARTSSDTATNISNNGGMETETIEASIA
ncbi:unnamed protein product [Blumeria hordei]|uniref:Uncharacterized protein n=2 Tax=Blumeria hordei TaxID=2867405 RepID=A0A383URA2_BLUHO|nr:sphingolipid long chain base-responsive protein [Blumeria hordei DH14]SZF02854.1 unnamed protein product [Blumeria hordei]